MRPNSLLHRWLFDPLAELTMRSRQMVPDQLGALGAAYSHLKDHSRV